MLNISSLACIKVELVHRDPEIDLTMPIIELVKIFCIQQEKSFFEKKTMVAFTKSNDEPTLQILMPFPHFSKSLKGDNIDIIYLCMLKKHNCLVTCSKDEI